MNAGITLKSGDIWFLESGLGSWILNISQRWAVSSIHPGLAVYRSWGLYVHCYYPEASQDSFLLAFLLGILQFLAVLFLNIATCQCLVCLSMVVAAELSQFDGPGLSCYPVAEYASFRANAYSQHLSLFPAHSGREIVLPENHPQQQWVIPVDTPWMYWFAKYWCEKGELGYLCRVPWFLRALMLGTQESLH